MNKELYQFIEGDIIRCFTSSDISQQYGGKLYKSTAIKRTEPESKNELSRASLEISFSLDNQFALSCLETINELPITLNIFDYNTETGDVNVIWKGRLASVKPNMDRITLVLESVFTSLRRYGLHQPYQRPCPHVLYGRGCKLNKEHWDVPATLIGIADDGVKLITSGLGSFADGYFTGGMVCGPDGILRYVVSHASGVLTLMRKLPALNKMFASSGYGINYGGYYGGVPLSVYPGCNRSKEMCNAKFDNLDHFGGFPHIPLRNPFNGKSIV